jgi:HSP20 family protein
MHPMFMQQNPYGGLGVPIGGVSGEWGNSVGNIGGQVTGNELVWTPAVDMREEEGLMKFYVALPGLKKENVTLNFREGCLTVSGHLKFGDTTSGYYWLNRPYGSFFRSIVFPVTIHYDEIHARMENGVLEIIMPKKDDTRTISIHGE